MVFEMWLLRYVGIYTYKYDSFRISFKELTAVGKIQ